LDKVQTGAGPRQDGLEHAARLAQVSLDECQANSVQFSSQGALQLVQENRSGPKRPRLNHRNLGLDRDGIRILPK
jgi:hypothetical protein